jgi:hypothetical protein
MIEAAASSTLLLCENWVRFWKKYFLQILVFIVEIGCVCSRKAYYAELKKHMYLYKGNHLCQMLHHVAHCFTMRTELNCERNTSCNLGVSRSWYALFASNTPIELSWRKTCISIKKSMCVRSGSIGHKVSLWEWKKFFKGILPANHTFQSRDILCLLQ